MERALQQQHVSIFVAVCHCEVLVLGAGTVRQSGQGGQGCPSAELRLSAVWSVLTGGEVCVWGEIISVLQYSAGKVQEQISKWFPT